MSKKISALAAVTTLAAASLFNVVHAGNSRKITAASLAAVIATGVIPLQPEAALTANSPLQINQTWNNAGVTFTGAKINVTDTASAAASLPFDVQVGGASFFNIRKDGRVQALTQTHQELSTLNSLQLIFTSTSSLPRITGSGTTLSLGSALSLGWSSAAQSNSTLDLTLLRGGAGILEQRNGTNAQTLRLYETYTDGSNYSYMAFGSNGSVFTLASQAAGTGSTRPLRFSFVSYSFQSTGGTQFWNINSSGHWVAGTDNAYDIGASGATRPRNLYLANAAHIAGSSGHGRTAQSTAWVSIAAAVTGTAHMNFTAGVAPSAPNNGDVWFDGTDFKTRVGGVTKTFTLS